MEQEMRRNPSFPYLCLSPPEYHHPISSSDYSAYFSQAGSLTPSSASVDDLNQEAAATEDRLYLGNLNAASHSPFDPLLIDVLLSGGHVVERWTATCNPPPPPAGGDGEGGSALHRRTYKKSIVLLRSLYSVLRLLPCFKIFKTLSSSTHSVLRQESQLRFRGVPAVPAVLRVAVSSGDVLRRGFVEGDVLSETAPVSIPAGMGVVGPKEYRMSNHSDPARSFLPPLSPRSTRMEHSNQGSPLSESRSFRKSEGLHGAELGGEGGAQAGFKRLECHVSIPPRKSLCSPQSGMPRQHLTETPNGSKRLGVM